MEATVNEVEGQLVDGRGKPPSSNRAFSAPQEVLDELAAHLYDPALRRAGLDGLTFHRLCHSAGHMMRKVGVPLEVIQRWRQVTGLRAEFARHVRNVGSRRFESAHLHNQAFGGRTFQTPLTATTPWSRSIELPGRPRLRRRW